MAITNAAKVGTQGHGATCKPHFIEHISMDMDADYPTGGYTAFGTTVKGAIGTSRTIVGIKQTSHGGGYKFWWDRANDTLLCYQGAGAAPDAQVAAHTNLAAITGVEFEVISV